MSLATVKQMADRVDQLLEERLHLKGGTLDSKLRRAGRRLPRPVRDAGAALATAVMMTLCGFPALRRRSANDLRLGL